MQTREIGIVMDGVTGRMGANQHLVRSVLAIIKQGGIRVGDDLALMPRPVLTGRNANKLRPLAVDVARREIGRELPYTTDPDAALADPANAVFFDASGPASSSGRCGPARRSTARSRRPSRPPWRFGWPSCARPRA